MVPDKVKYNVEDGFKRTSIAHIHENLPLCAGIWANSLATTLENNEETLKNIGSTG